MADPHAACDRIDITSARITQDIGVVTVIDTDGLVLAISSDHYRREWVNRDVKVEDLERVNINDVFHEDICKAVREGIVFCRNETISTSRTYVCDIFFAYRTYLTIHAQADGRLVLEVEDFERKTVETTGAVDTLNLIGRLTSKTVAEGTVNFLCAAVFDASSYDRAMTYKFLDDLSGEVVYEIQNEIASQKGSFLGFRFPPGDIPLPARQAYVENPVRFISDVDSDPCYLLQPNNTEISWSRGFLRGCVSSQKTYLKHMGVKSSLSVAITNSDGGLWGIVTMHSYSKPIVPEIEQRASLNILASVASSHVQKIEDDQNTAIDKRMKNLISHVDPRQSLGVFVVKHKEDLFETFGIDSISLFTEDAEPTIVGENGVVFKDLPANNEPLSCGILKHPLRSFACLSVLGYKIVFTRMCKYNAVQWAVNPGNPEALDATHVASSGMAMPRKSFKKYLDHKAMNPPPFTKRDRLVLTRAGEILEPVIHRMKIEDVEKKVARQNREIDIVEMKSDENYAFFANMSHELRTPLHAISGVFDIMQNLHIDDSVKNQTQTQSQSVTQYCKIGLDTCKDMMKTLNHILSIVRKTHEDKRIQASLVMVKEIFNSTSRGLGLFATGNDVCFGITFDCDPNSLVRVDVHKTIQIFNNIVGNAIKFTPRGGEVGVRVHVVDSERTVQELWERVSSKYAGRHVATNSFSKKQSVGGEGKQREPTVTTHTMGMCAWLVFQTNDEGCGVEHDDLTKIFQIFSQVGEVVTKKFASTGLGLHISLRNVSELGGFLGAASTPREGSLFVCAIPVQNVANGMGDTTPGETGADDPTRGLGSESAVFVVVDDSKVNVMIAKKQIERAFPNAKIYTAYNGKLGAEEVVELDNSGASIDGIFMDYHMPVMSGLEATRQIRRKASTLSLKNKKIPVAMLTADITETSRQSMLACGADFILLKPTKPKELVEMCAHMIELKRP